MHIRNLIISVLKIDMDVQEALRLLEHHNKWRRGADIPMLNPTVLGEVIDIIVKEFKK